jgi:hypothetical protein
VPQQKTFFFHIPKCGGVSVWTVLKRVYGQENVRQVARVDDVNRLKATPSSELLEYGVIGGHGKLQLYRSALGEMSEYYKITTFRDPIERVTSFYHHVRRDVTHPLHEKLSGQSFDEFAATTSQCNRQVNLLTDGTGNVEEAVDLATSFFDDWAFCDELPALVTRLCLTLKIPPQTVGHDNRAAAEHRMSNATRTLLRERCCSDMEFVRRMKARAHR